MIVPSIHPEAWGSSTALCGSCHMYQDFQCKIVDAPKEFNMIIPYFALSQWYKTCDDDRKLLLVPHPSPQRSCTHSPHAMTFCGELEWGHEMMQRVIWCHVLQTSSRIIHIIMNLNV